MLSEIAVTLRFFSRLPVPGRGTEPPLARSLRTVPLAGLILGACAALPLWLAAAAGLTPALAAVLALVGGTLASGALHEDGLADTADGLGGGTSRERKLAIMRDSRIGTYGVLALLASVAVRGISIAALLGLGVLPAITALLGAAALTRSLALLPLATLPPARTDGLGRGVGVLRPVDAATALTLGAVIGLILPAAGGLGLAHAGIAALLSGAGAAAVTRLAWRGIGGHTGDIAGACQQVSECAYLVGLLAFRS